MGKRNSLGVFCIILGTALADSPSLIPTLTLTLVGIAMFAGGKLCEELEF